MTSAADADWRAAWQPLIEAVGTVLDDDGIRWGPEVVELGGIRRYTEVLELDSAVHRGPDAVAPYTMIWPLTIVPMWEPGDPPLFTDAARDTQPLRSPIADDVIPGAPRTTHTFGTSVSTFWDRPPVVGERLGNGPRRLVEVVPKQTSVGRGAFVTFEREIVSDAGDRVCRTVAQMYLYNAVSEAQE